MVGLELLFDVLDAGLGAVVVVVGAEVIVDILRVVCRPLPRVRSFVFRRTQGTVGPANSVDLPFIVRGEDVLETAGGHGRSRQ